MVGQARFFAGGEVVRHDFEYPTFFRRTGTNELAAKIDAQAETLFPVLDDNKALPAEAREEMQAIFRRFVSSVTDLSSAQFKSTSACQKRLIGRHAKNAKPLVRFGLQSERAPADI